MATAHVDIPKGKDVIRVQETEYGNKTRLDARVWYEDDTGEYKPTKKGLCLDFESWPVVLEAIQNALNERGE